MFTLECDLSIFRKKIILMFLLWCSLYAMWYQLNMVNFFFKVDGWSFIYTPMHECKLKTDDTVSYVSITATAFPDLRPFRQNYRCFTCSIKINVKRQNPAKTSRTSLLWHLAPQSSSGMNEFEGTFLKGGGGNTAPHIPWLLYSFPRPASSFTVFTASASLARNYLCSWPHCSSSRGSPDPSLHDRHRMLSFLILDSWRWPQATPRPQRGLVAHLWAAVPFCESLRTVAAQPLKLLPPLSLRHRVA